jgi:hypothetical protein
MEDVSNPSSVLSDTVFPLSGLISHLPQGRIRSLFYTKRVTDTEEGHQEIEEESKITKYHNET